MLMVESKEYIYISKDEIAPPTIQLDTLILSLFIGEKEGRDVATADLVGAYLWADTKDHAMIRLTGKTVDIMCEVNNKYKSFVSSQKEKYIIYLKLKKALYGCMQSSVLWYDTFK